MNATLESLGGHRNNHTCKRLGRRRQYTTQLLHILRYTIEILRHTNNHTCRTNKAPLVYDPKAGGRLKDVQSILSNRPQQSAALSSPAAAHLGVTVSILEAHKTTPDNPTSQGEVKERLSNNIQNI
jgi:hypothetical protein